MAEIAIIDYGAGNLQSVVNMLRFIGADSRIVARPDELAGCSGIVIPGVGAMPDAMDALDRQGLTEPLREICPKRPTLGICLGMQMLFESSDEVRDCRCLALLRGEVHRLKTNEKLPHIGWNSLDFKRQCPYHALSQGDYVYFVHSYAVSGIDEQDLVAVCTHGIEFPAIVQRGSILGCQFHPEKSGATGLALLKEFAELTEESV